jgi:hypothetical protein
MATNDDFTFEPPEPPGPDNEANEASIQKQLQEYRLACEQEFELGVEYQDGKLTPQQVKERTEELLTQGVPKAVARLLHVITHSTNDALAAKTATWLIDRTMGKEGLKPGDPLNELLEGLRANDPAEEKKNV